jgi:hypothetical protein
LDGNGANSVLGGGGIGAGGDGGCTVVCCFAGDTLINTPEGWKKILDLEQGAPVWSWDFQNSESITAKVRAIVEPQVRSNQVELIFGNGLIKLHATVDHPFYVRGKGWCAYDPAAWTSDVDYVSVKKLARNDMCHIMNSSNGKLEPMKFTGARPADYQKVYTLDLDSGFCYFAGGILVHQEVQPLANGGKSG